MEKAICTLPGGLSEFGRVPTTRPTATPLTAAPPAARTCVVCGTPLPPGTRSSAKSCSARCRSIKSRATRLRDLLDRLRRAEAGLREAADGLAEYRRFLEHHSGKVAP